MVKSCDRLVGARCCRKLIKESWIELEGRYVKRIAVMQIRKGRSSFMNEMAAFYRFLGAGLSKFRM